MGYRFILRRTEIYGKDIIYKDYGHYYHFYESSVLLTFLKMIIIMKTKIFLKLI